MSYDLFSQAAVVEKTRYSAEELVEFRMRVEDTIREVKAMELGKFPATTEERREKFLKHLQDALRRISNGTYGVCRVTGRLIPKDRLMLVPHATICVDVNYPIVP